MGSLVFVGSVNADTIAVVPHLPGRDERQLATAVVHAGGGNSATAAVTAARLGGDVAFVGPVAEDHQGERILADLAGDGVDTSGVVRVPAGSGGASVVLVDQSSGTRSICTRRMPDLVIPRGGRALELIAAASWVHADHLGWAAVHGLPELRGRRLSVDAGNPIPGFSPAGVDLYGPTLPALRRIYGDRGRDVDRSAPADLLARALADGAGSVVATDGSNGSFALGTDHPFVHVPAFDLTAVSTLGAGDVYHGALVLAVDRGLDLPAAMRFAAGAAALSCRAVDGRSGIPDSDELAAWLPTASPRSPAPPPGPHAPAGPHASTPS
jgi:sulfofructose kinase